MSQNYHRKACFAFLTALLTLSALPVLAQSYHLEIETSTVHSGVVGSADLTGFTTYRFNMQTLHPDDEVLSVSGNNDMPLVLNANDGFFNSEFALGATANGILPSALAIQPELEYDSYVTIGLTEMAQESNGEMAIATDEDISQEWTTAWIELASGEGQSFAINTADGGGWSTTAGAANAVAGPGLEVLIMQLTTQGDFNGQVNIEVALHGDASNTLTIQQKFDGTEAWTPCTDENACNFDPDAPTNDYSTQDCEYAEEGYDCDGNCTTDTDGDGVCDEFEIAGCQDELAFNFDPDATDDSGECVFPEELGCHEEAACNYEPYVGGDLCLQIETVAVHTGEPGLEDLAGYTTYKVYALCQNQDDFVSSVSGDDEFPTWASGGTPFYQSQFGGAFGSNLQVGLFGFFPNEAYDSFVTIGLEGPAGSGEGTINMIDSPENPWPTNFEESGVLTIDDPIGGAWFIFNGNTNGIAGEDYRVLLAQFTAQDELSGQMYVQVFLNGSPATEVRQMLDLGAPCYGPETSVGCEFPEAGLDCDGNCLADSDGDGVCDGDEVAGCDDSSACNYDAAATENDGSCTYPDAGYDCGGNCLNDADGDGTCDEFEVAGCTDTEACNFDAAATELDDSCEYPMPGLTCSGDCINDGDDDGICDEDEVPGCQDETACNYDAEATDDDNSCEYPEPALNCDGSCVNDVDGDGTCDEFETGGCTDAEACNYDASATEENGTCQYPEEGLNCDGSCAQDTDGDGVCDFFEIPGCTDDAAFNFDPAATDDDGSCLPPSCNDEAACNFDGTTAPSELCLAIETYAIHNGTFGEADLTGYTTYRVYANLPNTDDFISSVSGDSEFPTMVTTTTSFYQNPMGEGLGSSISLGLFGFFPALEFDSWATIGLIGSAGPGEGNVNVIASTELDWLENFENGQNLDISDEIGGAWYILNGNTNGIAGEDHRVLLGQFTTDGQIDGQLYVQVFTNGDPSSEIRTTIQFADACATFNNDLCEYPEEGLDCDGNCLNDADGDGVCDENEVAGCTDASACNFDSAATDDNGSCTYPTAELDCEGNCLNDADGDGTCDEFEVMGCTDETAYNFEPWATEDDESCIEPACNDEAACNFTAWPGANGMCIAIETVAVHSGMVGDVDMTGLATYRIYAVLDNSDDFVSSVAGDSSFPTNINTTTDFFQADFGDGVASGLMPGLFGMFPTLAYDSWVTIGLEGPPAAGEGAINIINAEENDWLANFEAGGNIAIDDAVGGAWFILSDNSNGIAGDDHKVLLAQLTTSGEISGQMYIQTFIHGDPEQVLRETVDLSNPCLVLDYSACVYPEEAFDCDGNCLNDADGDGVCDEFEVPGCTDAS
ncbi:MAG: hypothetical protein ACPGYK_02740, partial [Flavobacteriales bacterium]